MCNTCLREQAKPAGGEPREWELNKRAADEILATLGAGAQHSVPQSEGPHELELNKRAADEILVTLGAGAA